MSDIQSVTRRVVDYQLAQYDSESNTIYRNASNGASHPCSWVHSCFYLGLAECAAAFDDDQYWEFLTDVSWRNGWQLGPRRAHADDHLIGQVYLEVFRHQGVPEAAEGVRSRLDALLASPPKTPLEFQSDASSLANFDGFLFEDCEPCKDRWSWCDALYMGPPLWFALASIDRVKQYREFATAEYRESVELLFDREASLFWRDTRFKGMTDDSGEKVFWGRGNAWIVAGLRRVIENCSDDSELQQEFLALFQSMMGRLVKCQRESGFWSTALSDTEADGDQNNRESSATGLIVAALAWGIRCGYLEGSVYANAVDAGWSAIRSAVDTHGRVGWVQGIDEKPRHVHREDTHLIGSGAVLHACAEMHRLLTKLKAKGVS